MRVIINITQFVNEECDLINIHELSYYLGYEIVKATCGRHEIAKRPHYHTMMVLSFDENSTFEITTPVGKILKKKVKIYKTLNKTINDILRGMKYEHEVKISFKYENGIGKDVSYDETSLQYPFKEYTNYNQIQLHLQRGFIKEELESMRKMANTEWTRMLAKKRKQEEDEAKKKNQKIQYKEYLIDKIGKEGTAARHIFSHENYETKIKTIIRHTLRYYKQNEIRFRMVSLKDEAVNFLFHHDLLTDEEIIERLYI